MQVTRNLFLNLFRGQKIATEQIQKDSSLSSEEKSKINRADLNQDGFVQGHNETLALFREIDRVDFNGSSESFAVNEGLEMTTAGNLFSAALRSSTKAKTSSSPLGQLLSENGNLRTNQDLINHFYRQGGGTWEGAQSIADRFGVNLNDLVRDRQGSIQEGGKPLTRSPHTHATRTPRQVQRNRPFSVNPVIRQGQTPVSSPTVAGETTSTRPGGAITGMRPVIGAEKTSEAFRQKVGEIAERLGMDPTHLMAVMSFETGGQFSPATRNRVSGATGLIQFMPSTARSLGTSTQELARMSPLQQLDYVEKYLKPYAGKMKTVEDAYMAVLWPAAVGKGPNHTLFRSPSIEYTQNRGLDTNGDGRVTAREAASKVRARIL